MGTIGFHIMVKNICKAKNFPTSHLQKIFSFHFWKSCSHSQIETLPQNLKLENFSRTKNGLFWKIFTPGPLCFNQLRKFFASQTYSQNLYVNWLKKLFFTIIHQGFLIKSVGIKGCFFSKRFIEVYTSLIFHQFFL